MDLKTALEFANNTRRGIRNLEVNDWKIYKKVDGHSIFTQYAINSQDWELEPEYKQISPVELADAWNQLYTNHFVKEIAYDSTAFRDFINTLGFNPPFTHSRRGNERKN